VFVVLFVGLFLVVPNCVCAKSDPLMLQWNNTYDNYLGALMIQTLDSEFLLAGVNATSSSQQCLSLVKTNGVGEVEWSKAYPEMPWVPTLIRLTDSGYLILHEVHSAGSWVDLLKVTFQGNIEWSHQHSLISNTYYSQYVRGVFVATNSSYVLVTFDSYKGGYASQFACYDMDGVRLWSKMTEQVCIDVVLQREDGYYVGGSQNKQLWFAKLDSMGEIIWSNTYNSVSSIEWPKVRSVISVSDGGFLLSGVNPSSEGVGFVVKVDDEGLVQWSRKYESPIYEVIAMEGQYLVFSSSKIICLSPSGKILWTEPYSKYVTFENLTNGNGLHSPVSAFVSGGDGLVVAIPHSVLGYYTSCLWVGGFTVEPSVSGSFSFFYVGLFVVVCVVVMGFLVCLRKYMFHR
jgi:hypothetical protein